MKRIRIIGSRQNGPEYLYEGLDFVAQAKVRTIVETYPLAEATWWNEISVTGVLSNRSLVKFGSGG